MTSGTNCPNKWSGIYVITVREQDGVAAKARHNNIEAHFGDVFGICGFKGSEFKKDDPAHEWKGRLVFRGSDVKDEYSDIAIFNELSPSPATLEASKAVDAYGLIDGHTSSQCDAEQAYVNPVSEAQKPGCEFLNMAIRVDRKITQTSRVVKIGPLRTPRRRWLLGISL